MIAITPHPAMTFTEQLNAFFTTPASRTKLVTLRNIWQRPYGREPLSVPGEYGVSLDLLRAHLAKVNPSLIRFVEAILESGLNLDAVLIFPLSIPMTRLPITTR